MRVSVRQFITLTAAATFIYAACSGFRYNYGLLLPNICSRTQLDYASVSFVIALGQLFFGLMQPFFGYLGLKTSNRTALLIGCAMMLAGFALIPFSYNLPLLILSLGFLLPSGTAGASFGILMGAPTPRMGSDQATIASSVIAGGVGVSICILSPILQAIIAVFDLGGLIIFLCLLCSFLIPATIVLTGGKISQPVSREKSGLTFLQILREGLASRAWVFITLGFFTSGFHMALFQTHLFSQLTKNGIAENLAALAISIYGIGVTFGNIATGMACKRYLLTRVLAALYLSRCIWVVLFLFSQNIIVIFLLIFALGATGVATLPPTAVLIGRMFGPLKLATLMGVTYFVHQIGAFSSAWTGGLFRQFTGSYSSVWIISICISILAGLACLCIRENSYEQADK